MNRTLNRLRFSGRYLLILWLLHYAAAIAATSDSRNVQFHGTLKTRGCQINNGATIEVHFGDLVISKFDGTSYGQQTIPYTLQCQSPDTSHQLTLAIKGTGGTNAGWLRTDISYMEIAFYLNGSPLYLNQSVDINPSTHPAITAVPAKQPEGYMPAPGHFTATATLVAEYL